MLCLPVHLVKRSKLDFLVPIVFEALVVAGSACMIRALEGMILGESFQVAALIEKLPPTWKDFKNYLKHKRKEMKLEDLIVRLRIEKDNRQSKKKAGNYHQQAKANVVEQARHIGSWCINLKLMIYTSTP
ncbi:hypothetical protein RJ639_034135 [Escallonia herrerae]|uniref:Uncharacterized protein n=1 Tax=Escallonia herrerae TaxID=1293975 RepID=A0AA88WTZ2_9ASTE|nr:hypothetical protein RJ639_034135 [Escallonia herrerae]